MSLSVHSAEDSTASHAAEGPTYSPWQRTFPPGSCDVAVVGGGIIGASTAYSISREAPELRVVLVEADRLAAGASGRNAGFLIPGPPADFATAVDRYGEKTATRILEFTIENVGGISRLDGERFGLRLSGCLIAAGSRAEAERLRRSEILLRDRGVACAYVEDEEVRMRTTAEGLAGGLAIEAGGTLDPLRLVGHLVSASRARVLERWPVTRVHPEGDDVRLVGPGGSFTAKRVLLCLNAYLPELIDGAVRWVRPVRAQMLATAPVDRFLEMPVYSHEGFFYVRQTTDGRVFAGGARHLFEADEVGYATMATSGVQGAIEDYLREYFPRLGDVAVERRWGGTMGFSPDGLPVAGELEGVPNAWFACGFTGHGMAYGLRFGQMMARLALGEGDDAADLFSPDR